jgi:hypothetical protein
MAGGPELGRALLVVGAVIFGLGLLLVFGGRLGLGRLPGDVVFRRGGVTFYFPIVTCLVLSLVLTLLFSLFRK